MAWEKIRISKLHAARRQLDTAIELWFAGKDPVSILTLGAAAYQIIHDINQAKGTKHDLLYDSKLVREEYRELAFFPQEANKFLQTCRQ